MKVLGVDHLGIAVRQLEEALGFYRDVLGLKLCALEEVASEGVRVAKLKAAEDCIELIEPLSSQGAVAKFLQRRGEGIHHLALRVDDVEAATEELRARGFEPLYGTPRRGSENAHIQFLRPRDTHGVLLELLLPSAAAGGPAA